MKLFSNPDPRAVFWGAFARSVFFLLLVILTGVGWWLWNADIIQKRIVDLRLADLFGLILTGLMSFAVAGIWAAWWWIAKPSDQTYVRWAFAGMLAGLAMFWFFMNGENARKEAEIKKRYIEGQTPEARERRKKQVEQLVEKYFPKPARDAQH